MQRELGSRVGPDGRPTASVHLCSMCATPTAREVRPRQRNDTHVLGSDWNLSSAPPLSEGTNDKGGNYGSRSFTVGDRYTHPDHPSHLALRRAPLNDRAIQFIVLKREGKWLVKSKDLERVFSVQREAVDAAIRFANDSGKEGKPGVVLFQKSKSKFEKIWTYGQSPYPPARSDLPTVSRTPEKLADALS